MAWSGSSWLVYAYCSDTPHGLCELDLEYQLPQGHGNDWQLPRLLSYFPPENGDPATEQATNSKTIFARLMAHVIAVRSKLHGRTGHIALPITSWDSMAERVGAIVNGSLPSCADSALSNRAS